LNAAGGGGTFSDTTAAAILGVSHQRAGKSVFIGNSVLLAQAEVPLGHCVYLEPMIVLVLETNLLEAPLPFGGDQLSLVCALMVSASRAMNVESV